MRGKSTPSKMMFLRFLAFAAIFVCLSTITSGDATLPPEEVEALRQIARTLGKTDWNFSVDPCSGESDWITPSPTKEYANNVTCNCTFADNTVCHVVSIQLKGQDLQGTLPPEVIRLPYLQELDLTRNYLNGTIPPEWGTTKLVNLSLLGNRISGKIPKQLGNITTLANLTLSSNRLSGTIPPELGLLPSIEKLDFTSNNLSGQLPSTLASLITLKDFRIGDSQFSGNIPNFISSWTNLQRLAIQGSGLDGPIPPGISSLTKLTDLRISDLKDNNSTFPPLGNATNVRTIILRSCNIDGSLPTYLGSLKNLRVLDLSFNRISGQIPSTLKVKDFIYLTGNLLTGTVPDWVVETQTDIDLSYNNLTLGSSKDSELQSKLDLNLFKSGINLIDIDSCSKSSGHPQFRHSLHINCGGKEYELDNKPFEDDKEAGGSAKFFPSSTNWAVSSTGHFLDDGDDDSYTVSNRSRIFGKNPELYMDARVSPLSLTYYGFCLQNGNYTINLHFAEIKFRDDRTYYSLGRRIFDIYIQGRLMQKDFNIEDEAEGVNKPIIRPFKAEVIDNTLNIRFYWAGKGTIDIPSRGVYGPLISAISVDPDFRVAEYRALSTGAIIGIVIAIIFTIVLLIFVFWRKCWLRDTVGRDFMGLDLQIGSFTLKQIKAATNNFDVANKIGEGGFGSVYKGNLPNGRIVAVKQLSSKSQQGNREFVNEIGMISALQHPNLVKLYGCCVEANQLLLVYEYMENNCLARALFGPEEHQLKLDWPTRHNICVGIARGLAYLHEESRLKIVHRDIKATNVLLDKNLNPKISDFGLAKLHEEETSHISTRIAGTFGYMAPEYALRGYLTDKADVYSFGIVLLEIVSGKCNTSIRPKEERFHLLDWALLLKAEGKLMELVDSRLESDFNPEEVMLTINVALLCTDVSPNARPSMSMVVSILEGRVDPESSLSSDNMNFKKMADTQLLTESIESQVTSISRNGPGSACSTSVGDLYPIDLDTNFWEVQTTDNSKLLR